jgi:hypothetical protein
MSSIGKLSLVHNAENIPSEIETINIPTVFTSHTSVFGPVTFIKLPMCMTGHNPVTKKYTD